MLYEIIVARNYGRVEGRAFWDRSEINRPEGAHLDIVVVIVSIVV